MNLEQWCDIDERIYVAESDERYKQYAGFQYSEKLIEDLAQMKLYNAKIFLDNFSEPRELLLSSVENIADSATKKLELKLYNQRNTKIVSKYKFNNNKPVNWSTWRQFNSVESDSKKRKAVFDEFISKTRLIAPTIKGRFDKIADVYSQYGSGSATQAGLKKRNSVGTPLDGYLENEKISYRDLMQFVKSMGQSAKRPFRDALKSISEKVLGRQAEYYDDFYFFRNKVYADMAGHFAKVDPAVSVKRALEKMQFDISKINMDTEDRKNKYPSPICFFIQVPNDIRVLYKTESPYFDLQGCYHEMGHAAHAASIDSGLEYWNRYGFPMGVAEIFSIFFERLTKNEKYISSSLGISDQKVLAELSERNNFMELFFVAFYTANSLMKAEYWRKNLSIDDASELYAKLLKEYVGLDVPGEYWMLHHILPDAIMYVPSYLLAAVRASELDRQLQDKFGESWWDVSDSGKYLREVMALGAKIDIGAFSKLDSSIFLNEITQV